MRDEAVVSGGEWLPIRDPICRRIMRGLGRFSAKDFLFLQRLTTLKRLQAYKCDHVHWYNYESYGYNQNYSYNDTLLL